MLTPGMYSCGNHMLLLKLLRSMVSNSLDEVEPSIVNGTPCLPNVSANRPLLLHCKYRSVIRM